MTEFRVVNASPLIFLDAVHRLDLLRFKNQEVVVPEPVWQEVTTRYGQPVSHGLEKVDWLRREPVDPLTALSSVAAWDLGPGETSVIQWAIMHGHAEVIIDDLAGRKCAHAFGLRVRGTLGLVLQGYQSGRVEDPKRFLEQLRQNGMWLSDEVITRALRKIGVP